MNTTRQSATLTIVALHGNGGGGFRFDRLQPFVSPEVNFVCPTLPGFADTRPDPRLRTLSDYADAIHPIVEKALSPVVLLGHGIGGSIALDYLQRNVDGVQGLILHAPVGASLNKRLFPRLLRLPGVADLGKAIFSSRIFRGHFVEKMFKYPVPNEYLDRFFEEYRNCSVFKDMFFLINASWFQSLRPIKVPSAIVWGAMDNVLTLDQLEDFRPLLHNPLILRPEKWDHFPMIDLPEEYYQEIVSLSKKLVGHAH